MTDYTVAVLEDAIRVLDLLQNTDKSLSLAQITEASGLIKNKVFRILYTLEKHELVERDDLGQFRLGLRCLEYGRRVKDQLTLLDASRPVMDWLVEETNETIFVGVVSGSDTLCIAARESPRSIRLYGREGARAPLHSGGVPKTLFAFLPQERQKALLEDFYQRDVSSSIPIPPPIERRQLEEQLRQIRAQGYAVVADELDIGAHSVAAPIRDHRGEVIAAISIAGPSYRFSETVVERYIELVVEAANMISQSLGCRAYQFVNGVSGINS